MLLHWWKKSISQSELGKVVGTSGDIIGKYERDEVKPSVEVASKIADALEVSLDFLVGKTSVEIDSKALNRLQDIQKFLPLQVLSCRRLASSQRLSIPSK